MKKIYLKKGILLLFLIHLFSYTSLFANNNPQGLWRTYDLQGKERSILKFYVINNELRADVAKILLYAGDRCIKCKGINNNKPFLGMTIIQGLKLDGDAWINGTVLDTGSGKTYGCHITLSKDGKIMYFHAYKGIPLFGRTIRWYREE